MSAPEYVGWQFRYVFEDQNDRRGSWGCVLIGVRAMPNNYRPHDADRPGRRCRYEVRDVYAGPVGGGPPAAPDLLQMLHECAEYIAALNGEQDDYCQRARALIARATGEPTAIGIQYSSWCDKHSRGTPCDKCAHLTAAEPDLLSVAYQASFALRQLLPNDLDAQMTVRMLEAAIAKATGASS